MHHASIKEVTDGHTVEGFADGRAQAADGRELLVLVVSESFEGQLPLKRHQLVHAAFQDELDTGSIHSMRIKAWTPAQWGAKGQPMSWADAQQQQSSGPGAGEGGRL